MYKNKYLKYKEKYLLAKHINFAKNINMFYGRGNTLSIDVYMNAKMIGRVVYSPYCLYSKFTPISSYHINQYTPYIEKEGYILLQKEYEKLN